MVYAIIIDETYSTIDNNYYNRRVTAIRSKIKMSVVAILQEPNGRKFTKRTDTIAEMNAVLGLTAGTLLAVHESTTILGSTNAGGTSYSDATFEFLEAGKIINRHFEQLTNSVADPANPGYVDLSNTAVQAYQTAMGGTIQRGKYTR